jgi:hypothetical protein
MQKPDIRNWILNSINPFNLIQSPTTRNLKPATENCDCPLGLKTATGFSPSDHHRWRTNDDCPAVCR